MRLTPDPLDGLLRAPAPRPKLPPSRERAAMNRLRVLQALAEHRHLRCVGLAAACWPGARYGQQMAQRTVRVLIEAGDLKARANALGSGQSFVLTRPGVAALELRGIAAHHGLDLAVCGATFRHGALTSRWCIHKQAQGYQAFTEYAIANGRAPLSREVLFKRLGRHVDGALIKGDKLYACETESAAGCTPTRCSCSAACSSSSTPSRTTPSASPAPHASAGSASAPPTRPRLANSAKAVMLLCIGSKSAA